MHRLWNSASSAVVALFTIGLFYGLSLAIGGVVSDTTSAILFVVLSGIAYWRYFKAVQSSDAIRPWREVIFVGVAAQLGIIVGSALVAQTEAHFWVADSVHTHVPSARAVADLLTGRVAWTWEALTAVKKPGALTHFWIGLWFAIFGSSAVASALGLTAVRAATIYVFARAGEELFEQLQSPTAASQRGIGRLGFLLYAAAPTVLFHTTAFYKEPMVHLFVAVALLGFLKIYRRDSTAAILGIVIGLFGLSLERFYVALLFLPLALCAVGLAIRRRNVAAMTLFFVGAGLAAFFMPIEDIIGRNPLEALRKMREYHASFADVSRPLNYDINYVLAVLKTMATPIWSPGKIAMFTGASALFTWGTFVYQFILIAYLGALYTLLRRRNLAHLFFQVPLLLLILIAAYVSPWAARIRDSFIPFMALYAFWYLATQLRTDWQGLRQRFR